jgi:hypothetical protein
MYPLSGLYNPSVEQLAQNLSIKLTIRDNLPPLKACGAHSTESCDVSVWKQAYSKNFVQLDDSFCQYQVRHLQRQGCERLNSHIPVTNNGYL